MPPIEQASGKINMHHAITRCFSLPELVGAVEETMRDGKILVKP